MKWMVDLHQALGLRYDKLGSTAKSLQHYEKAKQLLYDHTGDHKELQSVCNNAGNTYQRNKVGVIEYMSLSFTIDIFSYSLYTLVCEQAYMLSSDQDLCNVIAFSLNGCITSI